MFAIVWAFSLIMEMWPCVRNLLLLIFLFRESNAAGCSNIDQLLHSLPYVSTTEANCTVGTDCSSVQCTAASKQNTQWSVGIAVVSCDNNPAIEINADIPASGIVSWSAIFNDQTEKVIPGYYFPDSNIKRQGYLKATLEKLPNSIKLSLTLKGCSAADLSCTLKLIINNQQLVCARKCRIYRPFECVERKETCRQIGQSNEGECVCLEGLTRDSNNICTQVETITTDVPTVEKDSASLAVNIVVPILVFIVIAALIYAAFKHGLIHQLMVKWSGRQFESMNIRSDDDDDDLA